MKSVFGISIVSVIIFILAIFAFCQDCAEENNELLVEITNGFLRGKDNDGLYYSWESIPYAEPPVDALRFEAPKPYKRKWSEIFDATKQSEKCMQWDEFEMGENKLQGIEDCLTINVYRPKTAALAPAALPVLVFIHGGCFMFGGVRYFDADLLMASGKVILVEMNYRLGPLGFLSTEDVAIAGNFGLKDQQLALQWTKQNIAKFGGDPDKIMLMGFSAGAASTHMHMMQESLKNLVQNVVSISGAALNPWAVMKNARENAFKLAQLLNCTNTSDNYELKHCLQQCKAKDIVGAVKDFMNFRYNPFTTFGPVIEDKSVANAFLTQHPIDIIKSGNFSHLPWLVSYTAEDGGFQSAELLELNLKTNQEYIYDLNDQWLEFAAENLFLQNIKNDPKDYARRLKEKYLGAQNFSVDNYKKLEKLYTDVLFKDGIIQSLQLHSQYSRSPVYGYVYDNPRDYSSFIERPQKNELLFGSIHMDDINLIKNRKRAGPNEEMISEKLIKMLTDFACSGKLSYDNCDFENNAGQILKHPKIVKITKNGCVSNFEVVNDIEK